MANPTYAWHRMSPADVDQDSKLTVTNFENRRQNQVTLQELLTGGVAYTGDVPHRHLATEEAKVPPAFTPNLLNDGCPDNDATAAWERSGYEIEKNKGFRITTTSGHYAYQIITRQAAQSKAVMGAGADITLALLVRARSTVPSAGELHFGLADGATTFKAGCKGVITASGITSAPKRYYMQLAAATVGSFSTDCRFLLKNHTTPPNQQLVVTALGAWVGLMLPYWEPGMLESESTHDDWQKYGLADCPIFDPSIAVDAAVAVTGA